MTELQCCNSHTYCIRQGGRTINIALDADQRQLLMQWRRAWEAAVSECHTMGVTLSVTDPGFNQIAQPLVDATGNGGAKIRLIQVCKDLADYKMPAFTDKQRENTLWYFFFVLVLMIQSGNETAAVINATFIEEHFPDTNLDQGWWLRRATAYAPLGLPLGTHV